MAACRCGAERPALEPDWAGTAEMSIAPPRAGWGIRRQALLEGYRAERRLPAWWRLLMRVTIGAAVTGAMVLTARSSFDDPLPAQGNINVLARLDEHTRNAGDAKDTIPSFLALRGTLGVIERTAPDSELVRAIAAEELRRGFCTRSVAELVRYDFPGSYNAVSDTRLERIVLEKHPEYHERLCALPYQLDASPGDVVKYELKPRTVIGWAALGAWTAFVTLACAVTLLILYFRGIAPALAAVARSRAIRAADTERDA